MNTLIGMQKLKLAVVSLLLVLVFSACGEEQKKAAQGLVKSGSTTADQLANYYSSLAEKRSEYLVYYRLEQAQAGTTVPNSVEDAFAEQEEALAARAAMAVKLKALYVALGELIDYDAPGEISKAAGDLKAEIEGVVNKKLSVAGLSAADTNTILTKAISALVQMAQFRAFKKNAGRPEIVLSSITELFESEQKIYVQIAQDYDEETKKIAEYLFIHDYVNGLSSFQKPLDRFGLQINAQSTPSTEMRAYTLGNIERQCAQYQKQSAEQADAMLSSLKALKKKHEDFANGRKPKKEEE
jgi:hypothetical protein